MLLDSKADILSYGMGEHSVAQIADALAEGKTPAEMYNVRGICYVTGKMPNIKDSVFALLMKRLRRISINLPKLLKFNMKSKILLRKDDYSTV